MLSAHTLWPSFTWCMIASAPKLPTAVLSATSLLSISSHALRSVRMATPKGAFSLSSLVARATSASIAWLRFTAVGRAVRRYSVRSSMKPLTEHTSMKWLRDSSTATDRAATIAMAGAPRTFSSLVRVSRSVTFISRMLCHASFVELISSYSLVLGSRSWFSTLSFPSSNLMLCKDIATDVRDMNLILTKFYVKWSRLFELSKFP